jgi:hypothetical protein
MASQARHRLNFVSIGIVGPPLLRPQQATDPVGDITPDGIRRVLIARSHRAEANTQPPSCQSWRASSSARPAQIDEPKKQLHQLIREAHDPSASLRLRIADLRIQPDALGAQAGLTSARPAASVLIDRAWPRASDSQRPSIKVDIVPAQAWPSSTKPSGTAPDSPLNPPGRPSGHICSPSRPKPVSTHFVTC